MQDLRADTGIDPMKFKTPGDFFDLSREPKQGKIKTLLKKLNDKSFRGMGLGVGEKSLPLGQGGGTTRPAQPGMFGTGSIGYNLKYLEAILGTKGKTGTFDFSSVSPATEMNLRWLMTEESLHDADRIIGNKLGAVSKYGVPLPASGEIGEKAPPNAIQRLIQDVGEDDLKRLAVLEQGIQALAMKQSPLGKPTLSEKIWGLRAGHPSPGVQPGWMAIQGVLEEVRKKDWMTSEKGGAYMGRPTETFTKLGSAYMNLGPSGIKFAYGGDMDRVRKFEKDWQEAMELMYQYTGTEDLLPQYKGQYFGAKSHMKLPPAVHGTTTGMINLLNPGAPGARRVHPDAPLTAFERGGVHGQKMIEDALKLEQKLGKPPPYWEKSTGTIPKRGGGDVPMMGQRGEFMIRKSATDALGTDFLNSLNKYHDGGLITASGPSGRGGGGDGGGPAIVDVNAITNALRTEFNTLVSGLQQAAAGIGAAGDKISNAEIKGTLDHKQEVNVNHNGAQVFNSMGEQFAGMANNAMQGALDEVSDTLGMARTPRSGTTANIPGKSKNTRTG